MPVVPNERAGRIVTPTEPFVRAGVRYGPAQQETADKLEKGWWWCGHGLVREVEPGRDLTATDPGTVLVHLEDPHGVQRWDELPRRDPVLVRRPGWTGPRR